MAKKPSKKEAKKTPKETSTSRLIVIHSPDIVCMRVKIKGLTPLVVNRLKKIEPNLKPGQGKRPDYNSEEEYQARFHIDTDGDYAFPAIAFKLAAIESCSSLPKSVLSKTLARQLFDVDAHLVKLEGDPTPTEFNHRLNRAAVTRIVPVFNKWGCVLPVSYNAHYSDADIVLNLLNHAGYHVGVGEGRPQKGRSFGKFTVIGVE